MNKPLADASRPQAIKLGASMSRIAYSRPAKATKVVVNMGLRDTTNAGSSPNGLDTTPAAGGQAPELNNDPSAGSPTETLLRLLLPLNDQV